MFRQTLERSVWFEQARNSVLMSRRLLVNGYDRNFGPLRMMWVGKRGVRFGLPVIRE
jgi:hypothetical protein